MALISDARVTGCEMQLAGGQRFECVVAVLSVQQVMCSAADDVWAMNVHFRGKSLAFRM